MTITSHLCHKTMLAIIKSTGIKPKLYLSDPKDAVNAIRDGRCSALMKPMNGEQLDATTSELNITTPMYPVTWTQKEIGTVKNVYPLMEFTQMPADIVDGSPSYYAVKLWINFVSTSDMTEDTAYNIVKGMWENISDQRSVLKSLEGKNIPEMTISNSKFPLHIGAIKYYEEIGLTVPKSLYPKEAKN